MNILGATPLDIPWNTTMAGIKKWLADCGFEYVSCLGMESSLEEIKKAASAKVNLVVSYAGMAAAEYMLTEFGINFVTGLPVGEGFSEQLAENIREAAAAYEYGCVSAEGMGFDDSTGKCTAVIIGESIASKSLAGALRLDAGIDAKVICPLPADEVILSDGDMALYAEEDIKAALEEIKPELVIADPLYRYVIPKESRQIELPHFAFSGRCFGSRMPDLTKIDIKEFLK